MNQLSIFDELDRQDAARAACDPLERTQACCGRDEPRPPHTFHVTEAEEEIS